MSAQLDDAGGITVTEGELRWVALADVDDPGDNVRADLRGLEELVASVRAHGVLQPVALEPDGAGRYRIAAGFRRCAAARAAGLTVVPALVREASAVERVERQVVENLQREALTPLEEGRAYRRLCDLGTSQRAVARAVGRSQSHVSRRLAILQLPEEALQELETGRLSVEDAERLIPLRAWPERVRRALERRRGWGGVAPSSSRSCASSRRRPGAKEAVPSRKLTWKELSRCARDGERADGWRGAGEVAQVEAGGRDWRR
jgi:ParB/RepB/Spo0J family partition protein